jgi:very-short-patch-repair endonuclease
VGWEWEDCLTGLFEAFGRMLDKCESPIEVMFAHEMLFHPPSHVIWEHVHALGEHTYVMSHGNEYAFTTQRSISNVRLDIFIVAFGPSLANMTQFAIELDGHDFHEKTKEQARRDKSRDRQLLGAGIHTLRYTGSEVVKDASECMTDAFATIDSLHKRIRQ